MDVEKKLDEFRRRRKQKETIEKFKNYLTTPLHFLKAKMSEISVKGTAETVVDVNEDVTSIASVDHSTPSLVDESESSADETSEPNDTETKNLMGLTGTVKYLTYFFLWVIPYILMIRLGFGAVYFCISALFFLYFNTRTRPKLKNEPSAYSVFNRGCAPIEGAMSSEQLEKQIRSGILA